MATRMVTVAKRSEDVMALNIGCSYVKSSSQSALRNPKHLFPRKQQEIAPLIVNSNG